MEKMIQSFVEQQQQQQQQPTAEVQQGQNPSRAAEGVMYG
jgi:hypothetical protein